MPSKCEIGIGHRICRVQCDRFRQQAPRLREILTREAAHVPVRPHRAVPGIELIGVLALRLPDLGRDDAGRDRAGDAAGDFVLHGEDIREFAVVAIRP
jgi:hypothetical protein